MKKVCLGIALFYLAAAASADNDTIAPNLSDAAGIGGRGVGAARSDFGVASLKTSATDSRDLFRGINLGRAREWLSVAVGSVTSLYTDGSIQPAIQRLRIGKTDAVGVLFNQLGDGRYALPSLGGAFVYGWILNDSRLRDAARFGAESFLLAGATAGGINLAVNFRRQGAAAEGFSGIDGSFPSAHATTAFSIAGAIAAAYHDDMPVPVLAYAIAALVGFASERNNAHWATDVAAGAVIGTLAARTVVLSQQNRRSRRLAVSLSSINGHPGLKLKLGF